MRLLNSAFQPCFALLVILLVGCRANLPSPNDLSTRLEGGGPSTNGPSINTPISAAAALGQIEQQLSLLQPQNSLPLIDEQLKQEPNNRTLAAYFILMGLADFAVNSSWHDVLKQLKVLDLTQLSKPRAAIVTSKLQLNASVPTPVVSTTRVLDQTQIDLYLKGNLGTLVSQLLNPPAPKPDLNRPYSSAKSSNVDLVSALDDFRYRFASVYQAYFQKALPLLDAMIAENKPIDVNLSSMQLLIDQNYLTNGQLQITDLKMLRALLLLIQGTGFYLSAYQLDFINNFYDRLVGLEPVLQKLWQERFGSFAKAFSTYLEPSFEVAPYLGFEAGKVAGLVGTNGRPNSQEGWLSWAIVETIQTMYDSEKSGALQKPELLTIAGAAYAEGLMQLAGVCNDVTQNAPVFLGVKWVGIENAATTRDLAQQMAQSISLKTPANIIWNQKNYAVNFSAFFDVIKQKNLRDSLLPSTVVIANGKLNFKLGQ